MILGSSVPLPIGKVSTAGMTDNEGRPHVGLPCHVLREVTLEDWVAEAKHDGVAAERIRAVQVHDRLYRSFYYEVSVD